MLYRLTAILCGKANIFTITIFWNSYPDSMMPVVCCLCYMLVVLISLDKRGYGLLHTYWRTLSREFIKLSSRITWKSWTSINYYQNVRDFPMTSFGISFKGILNINWWWQVERHNVTYQITPHHLAYRVSHKSTGREFVTLIFVKFDR